jgi:glycosyltransferase involved in cell wall biosynthesis
LLCLAFLTNITERDKIIGEILKIALVTFTTQYFGGGNKFVADLASGLTSAGFDIAICAWDRPLYGKSHEEFLEIPNGKWFVPTFKKNVGKLYKITFNLAGAVKKCLKEYRPDVLVNANVEPAVLRVGPENVKRVTYVHYPTELKAYKHSLAHEIYRSVYWSVHYGTIKRLDAVVCNSNYTKDLTYAMWKNSLPEHSKYHVIYPCVDVKKFSGEMIREPKVCYVGRIDKNKGIDMVVDAFLMARKEQPNLKLEIVGGVKGSPWAECYYPELLARLNKINCSDIVLKTDVPTNEIVSTLLTSRCMASFNPEEHFGIVPIEAMAAGTPPIVADGGGQRETVLHGETGFLVKNTEEMKEAIIKLSADEKVFYKMSINAKKRAAEYFSKERFVAEWTKLLGSLS